jgi:hypothetical protein
MKPLKNIGMPKFTKNAKMITLFAKSQTQSIK